MASDAASSLRVWPVGGGRAGALIQARDWSRTPLGEIGQWPERLRAAVDNCLAAAFASFVWWGPELIQFYNDPALAIMRARHPDAFGVPAREAWSDVWMAIGPAVERVMGTGRPVVGERVALASGQGDPRELTRLRFSYSALRDGAGAVAGILVSTFEATERACAEPVCCRTSFEAMDQGYLLVDVIVDEAGRAVDLEYVEANPAAIQVVGDDMTGRRVSESGIHYEPYWYEVWGRVARTGKGERLQRYAAPLKRWFDFFVFKPAPNDRQSRRVAVLFQDVTEPRKAATALRDSEERHAFMLKLSDALRQLHDPGEIILAACRRLGEHLGANRVSYVDRDGEEFFVRQGYANGVAPFSARGPISAFGQAVVEAYRRDETIVVDDVASDPRLTETERATLGAAEIAAFTGVALIKNARLVGAFEVHSAARRDWTAHDLALTREVAQCVWWAAERAGAEAALAESQARMVLMVAELQHRTRNLIAVVRSIISHTLAACASPDEFKRRIDDRLGALSRVHGLLSRAEQEPITIGLLVRMELDALGPVSREQVDISGPEVRLRSSIVQTLALALHELAINARKYGALSTDQGRLRIAWKLERRRNAACLVFNWVEENGRRAAAPPGPKGYGRELIEQALPYSHGAESRYQLDETGLRCSIALPLGTDTRQERRS
jgi:two-component sensor histidine kinase/PAS domain-containing protein